MKRRIYKLIILLIIANTLLCSCTGNVNKKDESENTFSSETIGKDEIQEKIFIEWINRQNTFYWQSIPQAAKYELYIDTNKYGTTSETRYEIEKLSLGEHTVKVIALDLNNKEITQTTQNFEYIGLDETKALNKAKNDLVYSIVKISIKKYNTSLTFIKKDEVSASTWGVICKKNGNTYWAICYSPLLVSSKQYDKTIITVEDEHGNEFTGIEINPTNAKDRILGVVSFQSNQEILPVVDISMNLADSEDILIVRPNAQPIGQIAHIDHFGEKQIIDGIQTKNNMISTDVKGTSLGYPVFDANYSFIGIILSSSTDGICFMQLKEILRYIDTDLQQKAYTLGSPW